MYTIKDVYWYIIVTLRDIHIRDCIDSFKAYYPDVPIVVVDNCGKYLDISKSVSQYSHVEVFKTPKIQPLTVNQNQISQNLFSKYKVLGFCSDDVKFIKEGFIELALKRLNEKNCDFVSLTTDKDPVAYLYNENLWKRIGGFNENLSGKANTDLEIVTTLKKVYGSCPHIGGKWHKHKEGWKSNYVLHLHGVHCVEKHLRKLGMDAGSRLCPLPNRRRIGKKLGTEGRYFMEDTIRNFSHPQTEKKYREFMEQLEGDSARMTGASVLTLLSKCVKLIGPDECYLEIGTWKGASLCSAAFHNPDIECYGIDNFSEFNKNSPEEFLKRHIKQFKLSNAQYFKMSYQNFLKTNDTVNGKKVKVLFYDGNHTIGHHSQAMKSCRKLLTDEAVIFIDDIGFSHLKQPILKEVVAFAKKNPEYTFIKDFSTESELGPDGFHCGLACFLFRRKK
jgi:tRNA G46 methylase TrmB